MTEGPCHSRLSQTCSGQPPPSHLHTPTDRGVWPGAIRRYIGMCLYKRTLRTCMYAYNTCIQTLSVHVCNKGMEIQLTKTVASTTTTLKPHIQALPRTCTPHTNPTPPTHTHLQWCESAVSAKVVFPLNPTLKRLPVHPHQRGLQWSEDTRGGRAVVHVRVSSC